MDYLLLLLIGLGIIGLLAGVFTIVEYIEDWLTMRRIRKDLNGDHKELDR